MIFKIKNLIIDFHYKLPEENWMGVCDLYIDKKHMLDFIDDNADTHLDWDNIDADIDWSKHCGFLEFGEDDVIQWLEDGIEDRFHTSNSDLQIILYSYLYECGEDIELEYYGENPFWFIHDLCHSQHDVSGMNIYVDQYVEENRMFDGVELAKELDMLSHVNGELITNITKGFKDRWDYDFNSERMLEYINNN